MSMDERMAAISIKEGMFAIAKAIEVHAKAVTKIADAINDWPGDDADERDAKK